MSKDEVAIKRENFWQVYFCVLLHIHFDRNFIYLDSNISQLLSYRPNYLIVYKLINIINFKKLKAITIRLKYYLYLGQFLCVARYLVRTTFKILISGTKK